MAEIIQFPKSKFPTSIDIDGKQIDVQVQRSKRRRSRIRFYLHPEGELVVECPFQTSQQQLSELIEKNRKWIAKRLQNIANNGEIFYPLRYRTGDVVHLLGEPHKVEIHNARTNLVVALNKQLQIHVQPEVSARRVFHHWVQSWAGKVFDASLSRMIEILDYDPKISSWSHRYMGSRWGTCSSRGVLRFNTHLVKTPMEAIDSVVLHELCHRQVTNHSPAFYNLMSRFMPDWHERDLLLRKYQGLLDEEIKLH